MLAAAPPSHAIDFYEIEIYDTDTAPAGHLALELHSNTTSTATGQLAKSEMDVHQVHETLEGSYGVVRWLEVGQYLATAKLSNGDYEYSGSRTKVHFGIPQTFEWPVQFGANIELDYMRRSTVLRRIAGFNSSRRASCSMSSTAGFRRRWNTTATWDRFSRWKRCRSNSISSYRR